jgi:hypothetical protein
LGGSLWGNFFRLRVVGDVTCTVAVVFVVVIALCVVFLASIFRLHTSTTDETGDFNCLLLTDATALLVIVQDSTSDLIVAIVVVVVVVLVVVVVVVVVVAVAVVVVIVEVV